LPQEIIVLKFGSSVLRTPADLSHAVHEIYRWYRSGSKVVAVVSAIGLTTDELLCEARALSPTPEPFATAELLATGERASAALLGVALDRSGVPARVLNPREVELIAAGGALDSELISVDVGKVRQLLTESPVLVVPGFFGTDRHGRTHLLGRGGSDLTAAFLAQALKARCRLIKDVDGAYESDPGSSSERPALEAAPRRFVELSYGDALRVAAPLIQPKAVSFVRQYRGRAEVAACGASYETLVYSGESRLHERRIPAEPLRVLLLGLGTVGFGVYQKVLANPEHFEIVGALVRDRGRYERLGVAAGLLRTRVDQVTKLRTDVVIDTLSDPSLSSDLAQHFLAKGVHFISAGKRLIAESGASLASLAERCGASLLYRAAVGGAAPMIEAVERCALSGGVASLSGVLNGSCNFILNRCSEGASLADALAEAQRGGFAECNPVEDVSGEDAVRKLSILSRHAFHAEAQIVELQSLEESIAERAREIAAHGLRLRQVGRASVCEGVVRATVSFEEFQASSIFGGLRSEWNALQVLGKDGTLETVIGRGAGRWPTTEAVLADLFDVARAHKSVTFQ